MAPLQAMLTSSTLPLGVELKKLVEDIWRFILQNQLRISLEKEPEFFSIKVD